MTCKFLVYLGYGVRQAQTPTPTNMIMVQIAQQKREELGPMGHVQKTFKLILPFLSLILYSRRFGTCAEVSMHLPIFARAEIIYTAVKSSTSKVWITIVNLIDRHGRQHQVKRSPEKANEHQGTESSFLCASRYQKQPQQEPQQALNLSIKLPATSLVRQVLLCATLSVSNISKTSSRLHAPPSRCRYHCTAAAVRRHGYARLMRDKGDPLVGGGGLCIWSSGMIGFAWLSALLG
jgi:hypothetical protein